MAQSGYTPLLVYGSSTAAAEPTAPNLTSSANGAELALNYADGKLFYKNSGGNVRLLAIGYGASTVTPTAGGIQYGTGTAVAFTAAGTAGYILQSNGASAPSWVAAPSTSPGGSTTQVQYNNAGAFAGSANFVFDGTNVGIGVTPESMLSVVRAVRVGQGAMLEGRSNSTVLNLSANQYISAAGQRTYITTGEAAYYEQIVGQHRWFTAPSGTAGNAITFTQAMMLDASGNLGIGTSSPSYLLHAAGTNPRINVSASSTGYAGYRASNTSGTFQVAIDDSTGSNYLGTAYGRVIYSDGAYPLQFATNATERMRITSAGNVGIGTSSVNNTLAIYQATTPVLQLGNSTTTVNAGSGLQMYITGLDSTIINQNGGYLRFGTSGSEQMRIDSSGNVSIGTSPPTLYGDTPRLLLYGGASSTSPTIEVSQNGTGVAYHWQMRNGNGIVGWMGSNNTSFVFGTGTSTERMRITSTGGLIVGSTIDPGSGNILVPSNGTIFGNNSSNSRSYIELYNSSTGDMSIATTYTSAAIKFLTGGTTTPTERVRISSTGGFSVGTTADPGAGAIYATGAITAYYSDARLKDVKRTIANALDKVSSLSGVFYTNNEVAVAHGYTSAETQVGLLAQDVEAVLPEVVKAAPFDLDEKGNSKSGEHYKTIQYERIIPLLVEAIKELRAEVQTLRG